MTRTRAYFKGQTIGFEMAGRLIEGTKADRRAVRAYLSRTSENYGQFIQGFTDAFADRCEQRIEAIRMGMAPRTINPNTLGYIVNHG